MINSIIDSVLETIRTTVAEPRSIYHGVAKLVTKKDKVYPKVIKTDTTISPDDHWGLQTYARILNSEANRDSQRAFGRNIDKEIVTTVRVVIIADLDYRKLGYDIVESLYNALPNTVSQTSPATYKYMIVERGDIDRDHDAIAAEEFGEIGNTQLDFDYYAFEFDLIYKVC